jgi:Protein of unknown function (DUF2934)
MPDHTNGTPYGNHHQAAELHDTAAHVHRVAAAAHDKQDHLNGHERSQQALEHSQNAYLVTQAQQNGHGIRSFGHEDIAALAHELWRARGCPEGSPDEDWFSAAQQLRSRNAGDSE